MQELRDEIPSRTHEISFIRLKTGCDLLSAFDERRNYFFTPLKCATLSQSRGNLAFCILFLVPCSTSYVLLVLVWKSLVLSFMEMRFHRDFLLVIRG